MNRLHEFKREGVCLCVYVYSGGGGATAYTAIHKLPAQFKDRFWLDDRIFKTFFFFCKRHQQLIQSGSLVAHFCICYLFMSLSEARRARVL